MTNSHTVMQRWKHMRYRNFTITLRVPVPPARVDFCLYASHGYGIMSKNTHYFESMLDILLFYSY